VKSPVASLCLACSSVKNLVKVTILCENELASDINIRSNRRGQLVSKD